MEFDNVETMKRAVEIGAGVSILPEPAVAAEVAGGTLRGHPADHRRTGAAAGNHPPPRKGSLQHHAAIHRPACRAKPTRAQRSTRSPADLAAMIAIHRSGGTATARSDHSRPRRHVRHDMATGAAGNCRGRPTRIGASRHVLAAGGNGNGGRRKAGRGSQPRAVRKRSEGITNESTARPIGRAAKLMQPLPTYRQSAAEAGLVRSCPGARCLRRRLCREHSRRKEPSDRAFGPGDPGQSDPSRRVRLRSA